MAILAAFLTSFPLEQVGRIVKVSSKEDLQAAEAFASTDGWIIMDCADWQIIPAGKTAFLLAMTMFHVN